MGRKEDRKQKKRERTKVHYVAGFKGSLHKAARRKKNKIARRMRARNFKGR